MNESPALAEHVLFRVTPFIDAEVQAAHLRMEAAYRNKSVLPVDLVTLSCMLAEVVALKNFKASLEREAKKNQKEAAQK